MTVDHIPLPFTAIRPLPPLWPTTRDDGGSSADVPSDTYLPEGEPPSAVTHWPRVFPSL